MSEIAPTDLVYALTYTHNRNLYFAARASGLFSSADGGITWQPAYTSLTLDAEIPTTSVGVSPDFTEDTSVFAGVAGGLLCSSDGGQTWQVSGLASPPPTVSALVISPNFVEDGVLLAGTMEDGIFRSNDRGNSWAAWNFGLLDLNVLCLAISPDFAEDETLFAGVESGIFRSTNGGRAWREVELPFGYEPVISLALSPNYTRDGTLFAGTEGNGLWISTDCGQNWTRTDEITLDTTVNAVLLDPHYTDDPSVLVLGEDALYNSRDGGQTWRRWTVDAGDMTAVAAPEGLHAPLLIGLMGGKVVTFTPPEDA